MMWDLHITPNNEIHIPLPNPTAFNGDIVTFDDTGANRDIALGNTIAPGDMTFTTVPAIIVQVAVPSAAPAA